MTDAVLSMLGLALKAGKVDIGEEPVGAAARAKKARVILVADDAAPSSQRRARSFAESGTCLCLTIPQKKDDLGRALGRTSVAMCAVTDIGFACAVAEKLSRMDEARYGPALAALQVKAQRARQRKQEQEAHEKNVRTGKKKAVKAPDSGAKAAPPEKTAAAKVGPGDNPRPPRQTEKQRQQAREKRRRTAEKEASRDRYALSRPVKKGKGSKQTGTNRAKARSH